ncbi:ThuA domain-containing protein [Micromonospora cremea]|uniref:Glucose/arabinose dehydrogenase, beta-propeller fold n=1 Tax=Micromonospora cremea TaxID=709881 RepID=A0A1N5U4V9_9ACTN|nr:ThuA domain-containing protein [Micromonospora cremea]SIM55347.1 Glucose/arabinose dehydrogenase, beta-propeller fold [Micromonospora cremea]
MNVTRRPRWGRLLAMPVAAALAMSMISPTPAAAHPGAHGDAHVLIFTKTTQFRHTEAIEQGVPVLQAAFADAGITSEHTEDSSIFNDEDLAHFDALVMFQASGDPWTADQKAAMERYTQAGHGIVAIHNATDMRGNYAWWDNMIGTLMPGHAATGSSPGLPGTVRVEDHAHPSTSHLPQRWQRADEWYNYALNVRGDAHVLATMDETTYDPGGNAMGYDHPISWCKPYDGGRAWMTGMGHFGAHYTGEPQLVQHITGGVKWAAGMVQGDCGGTTWDKFERVPLDQNTSAPYAMDVAPDGRVFYTELVRGEIRVYDPRTQTTSTAVTIPVYSGGEDGLLGITIDPNFADNGHLYVYYSPASSDDTNPASFVNRLSRLTVGEGSQIDRASEKVLLEVPARRLPDEPGHTGGGLDFGLDGNLYLGVGDDVNPHSEPSGGYAPLSERDGTFHDARATSANTNDLRGKVLRIHPEPEGTYTIPEGNMFPPGTEKTRPEIYAMGFRNPFRFAIDPQTGALAMADYSPDNGNDNPDRGPAGIAEWNLITEPGFYGWPLCMGNNEPFRDVDYRTNPVTVGAYFDCANPVNDSIRNTGLTQLPAAKPAKMWYGYKRSSVPSVIPQGGGLAPMGGPFYQYDPQLQSDTKFPAYYDGKPFFYEWSRNKMYSIIPTGDGNVEKVNPFLPQEQFLAPIDSKFGPEGSLYVLDWGGGFGRDNPNSGLYRIDYISGSRSPEAKATATPDSGHAPLEVRFDGAPSSDPEGEPLMYAWDFDGDATIDSTERAPTHTYTDNGVYNARLTVTDPHGKTGTTTVPITVGNKRPEVSFELPPTGAFFDFGDEISWNLQVTDAEDTQIDDADVVIQPALGHDEHAHPAEPLHGRTGTVAASLGGGHSDDMNVFYALDGRYTDSGGPGGIPPLTGSDTTLLFPKQREAEFFDTSQGVTVAPSRDVEGHANAITGQNDAWASYDPVNLRGVDKLVLRVSAASAGTVELRRGAPDGALLGTAQVPATAAGRYLDVPVAVTDPGETFALYAVFPGAGERRLNFIEADGKGVSPTSKPKVTVTAPTPDDDLEPGAIQVTADASDAENTITKVEFFVGTTSIGTDTTAPYSLTWNATTEQRYRLTAVATNDRGASATSRIVEVEVGDLYGDWQTFSNTNATYDRPDTDTWVINSGGANMWQGTDQYGSVYLPAAAGNQWTATVKIERQTNSNPSAKAGLIVRNDVTQPGTSPGYAAMTLRAGLGFEWLRDTDGNGQLDASTGASTTSYPAWVRIVRDGNQYYGYWSKDGVTFTRVGDPVTLPGAASPQDIGLAVTAHSTSATSEAEFSGFSLVDEAIHPGPDPEPEPGPGCVVKGSDTFDGATLDTTRWTVVRNAPNLPARVADGALALPVTNGDINEDATGPISYVGQPARAGAWTVETKVSIAHSREWQHAGLLMHGSDNDYVKLAFTRNSSGGRLLEFQTEAAGTRRWHATVEVPADFPSTVHLQLVSDGSKLTAAYSTDGASWTALAGEATVIPRATIGLMAAGDTETAAANAVFDDFTVTPDSTDDGVRGPTDEFDGDALDGCRWDAVVRYDSSKVAVTDGQLRIETQPGDVNGGNTLSPRNFILQDLPDGDWTIQTRLTPTMLHRWQLAGFLMYADDDNYVKFDVVATNTSGAPSDLRAELVSERNGEFGNGGNRSIDVAEATESGWYDLRLTRTGNTYSADISDGGVNWTSLGAPVTNDAAMTSFGLMALGPEQVSPVTVAFDYFRVVDTTPPTVSVAVDPAAPNGKDGWYVSPITMSATGTDDRTGPVGISYAVGDGAWADYREPVKVTEDGTHELRFRAVDEAGNTSPESAVSLRVDSTAPVVSFAGVTDGGSYQLGKMLPISASAKDPASGVASLVVRLDGEPVTAAVAPTAGTHQVAAVATDKAGNEVESTASFEVVATFANTEALIDRYREEGLILPHREAALKGQLKVAERMAKAGQKPQAEAALDRFATFARTIADEQARTQLLAAGAYLRVQL